MQFNRSQISRRASNFLWFWVFHIRVNRGPYVPVLKSHSLQQKMATFGAHMGVIPAALFLFGSIHLVLAACCTLDEKVLLAFFRRISRHLALCRHMRMWLPQNENFHLHWKESPSFPQNNVLTCFFLSRKLLKWNSSVLEARKASLPEVLCLDAQKLQYNIT